MKREFGCAAGWSASGVQSLPCQSIRWSGTSLVIPSHHVSPSSVSAVLVKTAPFSSASMALGVFAQPVPGATPKNPFSGLIARRRPSSSYFIQAMSSPIVSTFQPSMVGTISARFVLPHADGNAPVTYLTVPSGEVSLRMSMCSAIQPSSRAMIEAIRSAKHFLPSSAFPP